MFMNKSEDFLKALPEEFKDKRAKLLLYACGFGKADFLDELPEDLTLAQLPEYLAENSLVLQADELQNFAAALQFDVKAQAQKIISTLFRDKRNFDLLCHRAEGETLKKIGRIFNLTRERVRQIEAKTISRFAEHHATVIKIFYFVHALAEEKFPLTLDDLKKFMDEDDAKVIYLLAAKANLQSDMFHFDKRHNVFVFNNETVLDETELIKKFPDLIDEQSFNERIETLAYEKNISAERIRAKLIKFYNRSGKILHRRKLNLTFECGYVLKERFPNGYRIANETFYTRCVQYLKEIFDEETFMTRRNLDSKIMTVGVLCGRGKYIHPDFVHVPAEVVERVKNFIDSSERTAIFYKEIFETLKDIFVGTQITNHYWLQGVIRLHKLPYIMRKDYLTKSDEMNMSKEFDSFVAAHGVVSKREITEHFVSFKRNNILFLLKRCPNVFAVGENQYMHASHLKLEDADFTSIKKFLVQHCSPTINSRVLLDLFFEHFSDFMTRNEINSRYKLFGVLQCMFHNDFNFSRPYISVLNMKNITNKKVLLNELNDTDELEIDDLVVIAVEKGIGSLHKNYLIDLLRPEFIRVDKFLLRRPESIGITDEVISDVVEIMQLAIERNGGWQAAKVFTDYEGLPQLEVSWNSFLLEGIATLAEDAIHMIKIPSTFRDSSLVIFVSEEFAEDDYQSFLQKVLIAEHSKEPFHTEEEILDLLKAQGLCINKLPKFLKDGKAFELLNE